MKLSVNGEAQEMNGITCIAEALNHLGYQPGSVAVALNEEFVPRTAYDVTQLKEDDALEIVAPMQGG